MHGPVLISVAAEYDIGSYLRQPCYSAATSPTRYSAVYVGSLAKANSCLPPSTDIQLERDATGRPFYQPIVFPNEFWHLRSQYIEINATTPILPLQVEFQPMSYWKFTIFASLTQSFAEAAKQQGASSASELDEVKRMLVETNPYFLALTGAVSVLHVL